MFGFIIPLLVSKGLTERMAKAVAWIGAVLAVALLVTLLWLGFHHWLSDQRTDAVQVDRADISAAAANRVIEADRAADANQAMADAAFANAQLELHDDALRNSTNADVGPGTRSVLERMREQQNAGRRPGYTNTAR